MGLRWHDTAIDADDPARLARWWAGVLHFSITYESRDAVGIGPDLGPGLLFVRTKVAKSGRNRLLLELDCDDLTSDVERLLDMGARHVLATPDQPHRTVMLADPEGNEFCVLSS